jgi:hypothetical protein
MRKLWYITILILLSISITTPQLQAQQTQPMRNVAISIMIYPENTDQFVQWITPIIGNFHNLTIIAGKEYNKFDWLLHNQTRLNMLQNIGEVIPLTGFMQTDLPQDRINYLQQTVIDEWINHTGKPPQGIFAFQPDTTISNYLKTQNVSYIMGYCFDQYLIDWMTMRGGWQLPYYASSTNALAPENTTDKGTVVLPWLTWDWIDSFTLDHCYDTHLVDVSVLPLQNYTNYVIQLIDRNTQSCSPMSYTAFSFEFDWLNYLGRLDKAETVLRYLLNNSSIQKLSCGNFTQWFKTNYQKTPTYTVDFTSPNSQQRIEWYYTIQGRAAKTNGSIVSYVNYQKQLTDKFTQSRSTVILEQPYSTSNCIDNSLRFDVDALAGAPNRQPTTTYPISFLGSPKDFIDQTQISPTPTPTAIPIPNQTPKPTATITPSASPTILPEPDQTPTETLTPQLTATTTLSPTETASLTPTAEPTAKPPQTETTSPIIYVLLALAINNTIIFTALWKKCRKQK